MVDSKSLIKSIKNCAVRIVNAYPIKELVLLFLNTGFKISPNQTTPLLLSVIDNKRSTQGLTDRLKGIVSIYSFAKSTNTPFRILFNHPFELSQFLEPAEYNWIPTDIEMDQSLLSARYVIMRKHPRFDKMFRLMPLKKQYRVYSNLDYLSQINHKFNTNYNWGDLFRELFKPTPLLQNQLNKHLSELGDSDYIACVFRFQSLLGDFKEYKYKPVSDVEQKKLLELNRTKLIEIIADTKSKVLVTSDSQRFIEYIRDIPQVYVIPGKVVHMDCDSDEKAEVYLKSFIDFFMISSARMVFSIGTANMYKTNFPEYAAKINNAPFKRILI